VDKGHGRREKRTVMTTTWLNDYLDWPEVGQVFVLWRERTQDGVRTVEEVFGITSLSRQEASAAELLKRVRGHWGIENQLFGVRDGTLKEDASRIRRGSAPEVMACLRNAVLRLLGQVDRPSKASATRHLSIQVEKAIRLLSTPT
jgi:predicted transposase YbfD/YdcC